MGLTAEDPGEGGTIVFEIPPQQIHQAVCYAVFDIGTQQDTQYGKKRKLLVLFELTHCRMEYEKDGESIDAPMVRHVQYNKTLGKASNLRRDLEAWRGAPFDEPPEGEKLRFDLEKLLGQNAQVQIVHKKGLNKKQEPATFANISMVISPAEGQNLVPENPQAFFSFEDYPEKGIPENTPDWILEKIHASKEYIAAVATRGGTEEQPPVGEPPTDDIPF